MESLPFAGFSILKAVEGRGATSSIQLTGKKGTAFENRDRRAEIILLAAHNYGWPAITYGKNHDGTTISNETAHAGMDQPLVYWVPSIAPSGMTIYTGDKFPAWKGNAFVAALAGQHLRRVVFESSKVVHQEELLTHLHKRFRDVRQGPDGFLYVLTDGSSLLRLEPAP